MEIIKVENLSFTYPGREKKVLSDINLTVNQGEFITVLGKSGCGKTTLLRLLKTSLSPHGKIEGEIYYRGKPAIEYSERKLASSIGFVMQNPENQIVTDKVWHELAFGLESLGICESEIRTRVSEMASFFGIQNWFYKNVCELSGGQKQLLNLAACMVTKPEVIILDEPTSQLDPIAAGEFLKNLERVNRELATTVILSEHRLEDVLPISDRGIVMDGGEIIAEGSPGEISLILKERNHPMYSAMPAPAKIYTAVTDGDKPPVTVRDGRIWLENFSMENKLHKELIPEDKILGETANVIEIKEAWFRYEKNMADVIKGVSLTVKKAELFAIVGGNGTGKTTLLSLIAGLKKLYRGSIKLNGKKLSKSFDTYNNCTTGFLPQNTQTLFAKNTVYEDLKEAFSDIKISDEKKDEEIKKIALLCRIENLLDAHPYDLSGGEQQRAALSKVLLRNPDILLLDEPTKGMDVSFKKEFAEILADLKERNTTVVMVSHDIEFCAKYADRCALVFDGDIVSLNTPRKFFGGNSFYTTSSNRMAGGILIGAILPEDVICACKGEPYDDERPKENNSRRCAEIKNEKKNKTGLSFARITAGILFALAFVFFELGLVFEVELLSFSGGKEVLQFVSVIFLFLAMCCFVPSGKNEVYNFIKPHKTKKHSIRTVIAALFVLVAIPATIYFGIYHLNDRKYYFISLLIIVETFIPFFMMFEKRKPQGREIVVISVLCAIAVAGRAAFISFPQFKPVVAMVIISGLCFGGETGFLVGAVTGFVSNFFFGQGPNTPWQMFAFGIIGFVTGVLFDKGLIVKNKISLCVYGFIVTVLLYGGIMNSSYIIRSQNILSRELIVASFISGLPFDLVHGISTVFFLWFISGEMITKLERIKIKYGLIEADEF